MIRVAKTAGFCFGVNRAVETVYKLLDEGKTVCTLGPIIHNPQLVEELGRKGVRIIDAPEDAKAGETVVIRSHGVPPEVIEKLKALGVDYKDATCPYVHSAAAKRRTAPSKRAKNSKIYSKMSLNLPKCPFFFVNRPLLT